MGTSLKKIPLAVMAVALAVAANVFAEEYSSNEAKSPVSREQAKQIALQSVAGGQVVKAEFKNRWFSDNDYDFVIVDENSRYNVRVDAKTGEVLKVDRRAIFEDNLTEAELRLLNAAGDGVTPQRARAIAMERVPGASVVRMDRNMNSERVVYDIKMTGANSRAGMKVDALTGNILSFEEEKIERDNGLLRVENRSFNRIIDDGLLVDETGYSNDVDADDMTR